MNIYCLHKNAVNQFKIEIIFLNTERFIFSFLSIHFINHLKNNFNFVIKSFTNYKTYSLYKIFLHINKNKTKIIKYITVCILCKHAKKEELYHGIVI